MKIIGITGKSGSGKSTLAKMLSEKLKCDCINIDKIGHKATSDDKISQKLCEVFGREILDDTQRVDRKKLGNIVFCSKEKMDVLTDITWGYMQKILDERLKEDAETILLEWALLPISKYWQNCDLKILMQAEDVLRKNKVMQRDQIEEAYFLKRDAGCIDYTPFHFDFIFQNDYKIETMEKIVESIRTLLISFIICFACEKACYIIFSYFVCRKSFIV